MSRTIRRTSVTALIVSLALGAAGFSSAAQTKSYALSGFNTVSAYAGVNVVLNQGPFAVQASEASGNFDKLVVEVRGSRLIVSRTSSPFWWSPAPMRRYTVTVTAPDYVAVEASSGSTVTGRISAGDLAASSHSGATLRLYGACASIRAEASSGATLGGQDMRCHKAQLSVNSGASLRAFADTEANSNASSGGNIVVHGNPASVERHTSSGGSIRMAGA